MNAIRLVIFDVAGTIIRDAGEVLAAFRFTLERRGFTPSDDELKSWKGASKREVLRHYLGAGRGHEVDAAYDEFRAKLHSLYDGNVRPIDGAERTFARLRERGIRMATTSGFEADLHGAILKAAGWEKMFDARISSDEVAAGRPAPFMIFRAMEASGIIRVAEVCNVGDTPLDLRAGSNAGIAGVVGVLTGAHSREQLAREPHSHLISSVADLPEVLALQ
jgi:phosphonatase-like hydrolase